MYDEPCFRFMVDGVPLDKWIIILTKLAEGVLQAADRSRSDEL